MNAYYAEGTDGCFKAVWAILYDNFTTLGRAELIIPIHKQKTNSERISGPGCIMNSRKAGSRTRAFFPKFMFMHVVWWHLYFRTSSIIIHPISHWNPDITFKKDYMPTGRQSRPLLKIHGRRGNYFEIPEVSKNLVLLILCHHSL